jgi:eukaryotic-like serine/threonine-protein kinase
VIGHGSDSEAPSIPVVDLLVGYDQAKGRGASTQALHPESPVSDGGAIACVDLLHRVWPSSNASFASATLPKAAVLGDFRIVREIGRGGMGVVYEAEQLSLQRRVALKVLPQAAFLDDGRLARFELEARTAATLEHPHIVPIFSIGCEQNVHYYAMQLIRGVSLAELYIQRTAATVRGNAEHDETSSEEPIISSWAAPDEPVVETEAFFRSTGTSLSAAEQYFARITNWGIQAAEALHYSHERGVIHRDIKPANLIVDSTGKLWITDFGLARLNDDAGMTYTGDLVGTLRYTSHERLKGCSGANSQIDVYSLGVTL